MKDWNKMLTFVAAKIKKTPTLIVAGIRKLRYVF